MFTPDPPMEKGYQIMVSRRREGFDEKIGRRHRVTAGLRRRWLDSCLVLWPMNSWLLFLIWAVVSFTVIDSGDSGNTWKCDGRFGCGFGMIMSVERIQVVSHFEHVSVLSVQFNFLQTTLKLWRSFQVSLLDPWWQRDVNHPAQSSFQSTVT